MTINISKTKFVLFLLTIVIVIVSIFMHVTGRWKHVKAMLLKLRMTKTEVELASMEVIREASTDEVLKICEERAKLEVTLARMEQELKELENAGNPS